MNISRNLKKYITVAVASAAICNPFVAYASDIDQQIAEQQRVLATLLEVKKEAKNNELDQRISEVQCNLDSLARQVENSRSRFDTEGAFNSITAQITALQQQLQEQTATQNRIIEWMNAMQDKLTTFENSGGASYQAQQGNVDHYLYQPDGSNTNEGGNYYTQDAVNSQGNSTMVFAYAPNQLYKIYCRRGFLTDLALHPGEEITYIAGGDTAGWSVSSSVVNGVPHLYIKPVVETASTNIIINTTNHTYQLIVNTSDWYNPMVTWRYDTENAQMNLLRKSKEEKLVTGSVNTSNIENLDFNYKVTATGGTSVKPTIVFSDGERTYIKFENARKQYPLFIRENGKRDMNLVNYKIKDGYYIIEKIFQVAQFRINDHQTITIKHKGSE